MSSSTLMDDLVINNTTSRPAKQPRPAQEHTVISMATGSHSPAGTGATGPHLWTPPDFSKAPPAAEGSLPTASTFTAEAPGAIAAEPGLSSGLEKLLLTLFAQQEEKLRSITEERVQDLEGRLRELSTKVEAGQSQSPRTPDIYARQVESTSIRDHTRVAAPHQYFQLPTVQPESASHAPPRRTNLVGDMEYQAVNRMKGWGFHFEGSGTGLSVESFIQRAELLTRQTLRGNFDLLHNNVYMLLRGKAAEWYYEFNRTRTAANWPELVRALREQFGETISDSQLMRQLYDRRQRPGEKFDDFLDALKRISSRMMTPLTDHELFNVARGALRDDVQKELLHMHIHGLSHLRQLCRESEDFTEQCNQRAGLERRSGPKPPSFPPAGKMFRNVNELQVDCRAGWEENDEEDGDFLTEEVAAIGQRVLKCWNCLEEGHPWFKCRKEQKLFCWGCGKPGIKTPDCGRCLQKGKNSIQSETFRPGFRSMEPQSRSVMATNVDSNQTVSPGNQVPH